VPRLSEPVRHALDAGGAVVALESTIIAHGLPRPRNLEVARELEAAVAAAGAVPATIALLDGEPHIGLDEDGLRAIAAAETRELEARVAIFGSAPDVTGRTVIVVDDGLATGATMRVAVGAVREAGAAYVMAAAPVGAPGACRELERLADLVVCPRRPDPFRAVGEHYRDFAQVSDDAVLALLGR